MISLEQMYSSGAINLYYEYLFTYIQESMSHKNDGDSLINECIEFLDNMDMVQLHIHIYNIQYYY